MKRLILILILIASLILISCTKDNPNKDPGTSPGVEGDGDNLEYQPAG